MNYKVSNFSDLCTKPDAPALMALVHKSVQIGPLYKIPLFFGKSFKIVLTASKILETLQNPNLVQYINVFRFEVISRTIKKLPTLATIEMSALSLRVDFTPKCNVRIIIFLYFNHNFKFFELFVIRCKINK
jgi:hypothetical protein